MRRLLTFLSSPLLLFYLLPPLMLLIAVGTVAQKYVGLYVAEKTIFSSFVIWVYGVVPLPGGTTLMALLSLNLGLKFLLKSKWCRAHLGLNLAHFGVLLLLIGGFITSLMAQDGFMTLPEGATQAQLRDYHQRDVLLIKDGNIIAALPQQALKAGLRLKQADLPFTLDVLSTCTNCTITRRTEASEDLRGMARGMQITDAPLMKNDETNTGGMTFRLAGLDAETDGTYILFEDGPTTTFKAKGAAYELVYTKQIRELPFSLQLVNFEKVNYPGTDTAKSYYSDVVVKDGTFSWPARIAMNAPLRYRGYTFYQSSFLRDEKGNEISVLAVSRNASQYLPYLGTAIMGFGLLLHLFVRRKGAAA